VRTIVGGDPFAGPIAEGEKGIELDTDSHSSQGFRPSQKPPSRETTGLQVAEGNPFIARCPIHEIEFDKRKADECRKCQAERKVGSSRSVSPGGGRRRLRDYPAKRAFIGLGFALFIGLVPAAYSAVYVGGGELRRLRAEQEVLSAKPGTEEVVRQFDDLDAAVAAAHNRSMVNTLVLWVLVSGGVLAVWYRLT
jgi:hypothetical protein